MELNLWKYRPPRLWSSGQSTTLDVYKRTSRVRTLLQTKAWYLNEEEYRADPFFIKFQVVCRLHSRITWLKKKRTYGNAGINNYRRKINIETS